MVVASRPEIVRHRPEAGRIQETDPKWLTASDHPQDFFSFIEKNDAIARDAVQHTLSMTDGRDSACRTRGRIVRAQRQS
ncbi:hypothetical protein CKO42_20280 [Lamprobacter modestohalophilus]|uniref:Uncharacterized protein n=1 Tax=Lamprobacter modestohalophilus TaxID=1064514 RepID=A0A9X0WC49_9GAMM|nr:hypothetical protein [Lamprobacter modestohalophilus]